MARQFFFTTLTSFFLLFSGTIFACCSTNDSCSGSLQCAEPISRMDCTDPYCFYPPTVSQVDCCRWYGDMGGLKPEYFNPQDF